MKILTLEPYYGGSHRAFIDGWIKRSKHQFTLLTLPANKWKWRMRHAAIEFASQLKQRDDLASYDILFASDMLNLAELKGLMPADLAGAKSVIYFHENQLTYPDQYAGEKDLHFGFTNIVSALAADEVWFNSDFHRDSFISAATQLAGRMPDFQPVKAIESVREKTIVLYPGVEMSIRTNTRTENPLRILWVARWERDKNPDDFFAALRILKECGIPFRLSVLGEQFDHVPDVFNRARIEFAENIDHWGYVESRLKYESILSQSDVVVSTAVHEFFGIAVVEAMMAGNVPLLPDRLSYPELVNGRQDLLYDGTVEGLVDRLIRLSIFLEKLSTGQYLPQGVELDLSRFKWSTAVVALDDRLSKVTSR